MVPFLLIIFVLLGAASPTRSQEIYSWADADGVRHFSDTSPQGKVHEQVDFKVETPAPRVYSHHHLYHVQDEDGYCGSRRLPSEKEKDPRQKLVDLLFARKSITVERERLTMSLNRVKKNKHPDRSDLLTRLEYSVDECDCLLSWMRQQLEVLEEVKDRIVMEARQTEFRHEEAQRECGPEPPYRGPTDKVAINWVECTNSNRLRRNSLLKEKKDALQREEALLRAME